MAKTSAVEKNKRRRNMVAQQATKRAALKATIMNQALSIEERFKATLKLASLPARWIEDRIPQPLRSSGRPRAPTTANCACRVSRCVNSAISARCRASSKSTGKGD